MGSDTVAIALLSFQLHRQPVTAVLTHVMQKGDRCAKIHHECIDLAVVVVVAETGAARNRLYIEDWPGFARDIGKLSIPKSAEERLFLQNQVDQTAVENHDVDETIIVEVVDS